MKFKAIVAVAFVLVLLVALATPSAANTSPVAVDDYYSMSQDTTLSVPVPGVLGNDNDPDGDPIYVDALNPASSGIVVLFGDGHFHYTPNAGFTGVASFRYYIADGYGGIDDAYAYITVVPAVVDVDIDIKPCSDPNSVNLKSKGVLPVAILSTEVFDATTVDWETVTLDGIPAIKAEAVDVNDTEVCDGGECWCTGADGLIDLVVYFNTRDFVSWDENTIEAMLEGETYAGMSIQGIDAVRIVTQGPKNP